MTATPAADARGPHARSLLEDLLDLAPAERRPFYRDLQPADLRVLAAVARRELGTPYGLWQDDPVGFVQDVLGDTTWSKQEELLESVRDNGRTAAPATHSPGKSFIGSATVCWWCSVWPIGTAKALTTAPKMRQVTNILWGGTGIARAHRAGGLPGVVQTAQWKVGRHVIAYGFSPADYDEDAVQGEHAGHVLLVVDEAGGISHTLGRSYISLLSQPHARILLLGNPPTDEEGSWFEEQAEKSALVTTIRIAAKDTPNFTGERTGRCTSCPPGVPPHRVALHLTSVEWVAETVEEFGEDAAYVVARVDAQFPHAVGQKVIPYSWVEAAVDPDHEAASGQWVRLGADIASDGGDEFAIARAVGYSVDIVHRSSGPANADPVAVAGVILQQTREACELRDRLGDTRDVHVKIDASGLGWGVAGLVKRQVQEAGLPARVFGIRGEDDPHDESQFKNARSEMWWNTRTLMKPVADPATGQVLGGGKVRLVNMPTRAVAQLSAPKYGNDTAGRIVVQKKRELKAKGIHSPDLADAINLALYEGKGEAPAKLDRATTGQRVPIGPSGRGGGPAPGGQVVPLGPRRRT